MQPIKILVISALLFAVLVVAGCAGPVPTNGGGAPSFTVYYSAQIYAEVVQPLYFDDIFSADMTLKVTQIISSESDESYAGLLKVGDQIRVNVGGTGCIIPGAVDSNCESGSNPAVPCLVARIDKNTAANTNLDEYYGCWNTYHMEAGDFPIQASIRCLGVEDDVCTFWEAGDGGIIKPPI